MLELLQDLFALGVPSPLAAGGPEGKDGDRKELLSRLVKGPVGLKCAGSEGDAIGANQARMSAK